MIPQKELFFSKTGPKPLKRKKTEKEEKEEEEKKLLRKICSPLSLCFNEDDEKREKLKMGATYKKGVSIGPRKPGANNMCPPLLLVDP